MKFLHFLNIIFAELPGGKSDGPGESIFFIFPTGIVQFNFNPRCKTGCSPEHKDRVCNPLHPSEAATGGVL